MKVKLKKVKCRRCGNVWTPRKEEVRTCARCRSALWDVPRSKEKKA